MQRRELHNKLEALRVDHSKENINKQTNYRQKPQTGGRTKAGTSTISSSASNDDEREDSSTDEEPSTSRSNGRIQKLCHSCETMKAEKMSNESEFVKMKMNIKFLNKVNC